MPTTALPSAEGLRQLLTYEPETGKLFWKERPREMFPNDRVRNTWNTRFAGKEALTNIGAQGYLRGAIYSQDALAHRVAWALHHGKWPQGQIDHINGVRTDNRICNLRDVSGLENNRNAKRSSTNTTGHVGVCRDQRRDKWFAQISLGNRSKFLGYFKKIEDAVEARKAAEREHGFHKNHGRVV
jgi:hypothetical protein